jgi:hypothetical protein
LAALFLVPQAIQKFPETGGDIYAKYRIMDDATNPAKAVGKLETTFDPERKKLNVGHISALPHLRPSEGTKAERLNPFAHSLGMANIKSLLKSLMKEYPDAKSIGGYRESGARTDPANRGSSVSRDPFAHLDLTKFGGGSPTPEVQARVDTYRKAMTSSPYAYLSSSSPFATAPIEQLGINTYNRELRRSPADGTFRTRDEMVRNWDQFKRPYGEPVRDAMTNALMGTPRDVGVGGAMPGTRLTDLW